MSIFHYALGLDIGTESIGWAILQNNGDRRKFCVIDVPRQYENLRLSQE